MARMEYRVVVVQEAVLRVRVALESRVMTGVTVDASGTAWRESFAVHGTDVYEALGKLGREAERAGGVREGLRRRVGQVRS